MKKIKLFCLPYAGGSATLFNSWGRHLNRTLELSPVELAGRGVRINTPFYATLDAAVEDLYRQITNQTAGQDYALFGHSLGGILAYEIAQKIRREKKPAPLHLFFSGRGAPHLPDEDRKNYHLMEDSEFKKEVLSLGGTPEEFFEHPELLELLLPMIKNDFRISTSYQPHETIDPLPCDISVLLGKEEEITPPQLDGWKKHTTGVCTLYLFPGGHFFINDQIARIGRIINTTLTCDLQGKG